MRVPRQLQRRFSGSTWHLVQEWPGESATWRVQLPNAESRFVKVALSTAYPDLPGEAARLRWAGHFAPVPKVLDAGRDDGVDWLVTAAIPATDLLHQKHPGNAHDRVTLFATGLRELHDALPVQACPFDFTLDRAMDHARGRVAAGLVDPSTDFHPEHEHYVTPARALQELERLRPGSEELVVCHGDYCPPNLLVTGGRVGGYVDLGELGVADRWWDVAVGTWSTTWNFGPGYEPLFLETYGAEYDESRCTYYRLLYDLVS